MNANEVHVGDLVLVRNIRGRQSSKTAGRVLQIHKGDALVLLKNHGHPEWVSLAAMKPWKSRNAVRSQTPCQ